MLTMANKLKPAKTKPADKDELKQEKEETAEIKQLLKDERTHKIAGSISLLISVLLFTAFTSYLFTWQDDQDKVFQHNYKLLLGTDVKVTNLLGTFGAFISHFFIYKGFGIASYLICTLFFVMGINLFFGKKIFSVSKNIKYLVVGLPLISVAAAVIMQGKAFAWGGAVGDMCRDRMYKVIGEVGTIGVLAVGVLSYIIWRFNPVFRLPVKKDFIDTHQGVITGTADEIAVKQEWDLAGNNTVRSNSLKEEGGMLAIPANETKPDHEIGVIEKEEQPEIPPVDETIVLPVTPSVKPKEANTAGLELEIKSVPEKAADGSAAIVNPKLPNAKPYDPILDLRDYKYPTLDLLENHGNEKIV